MKFVQKDFSGGINLYDLEHAIAENEYGRAFNIRARDGSLTGIYGAEEITSIQVGSKQAIYGYENYLFIVSVGRVWWKNITTDSEWAPIGGISLSQSATRIYFQPIPIRQKSYLRKLRAETIINGVVGEKIVDVTPDDNFDLEGGPAGIVVQDGTKQPILISFESGQPEGRALGTYNYWTKYNREYVPVGKQMAYINGILFIVSSDGKQIYRSVSGEPLNFVVNVNTEGDKGGEADTVSFTPSTETITSIIALNSGELLIGSTDKFYAVSFDYENTIFQEPKFITGRPIYVGSVNQFSLVDILGDIAVIDVDGIKSFNAVAQKQNEGRNAIFSVNIASLFEGILQNEATVSAMSFDNYGFFSVNTTLGYVTMVYDMLRQKWVSIDNYNIGAIKQFAVTKQATLPTLYCITDNKAYKLFGSSEYIETSIKPKSFISEDAQVFITPKEVRPIFDNVVESTSVSMSALVDGKVVGTIVENIIVNDGNILYPANYPVEFNSDPRLRPLLANFSLYAMRGFKAGTLISWRGPQKMFMLQVEADEIVDKTPVLSALNLLSEE